jgi:hypothetical protein
MEHPKSQDQKSQKQIQNQVQKQIQNQVQKQIQEKEHRQDCLRYRARLRIFGLEGSGGLR